MLPKQHQLADQGFSQAIEQLQQQFEAIETDRDSFNQSLRQAQSLFEQKILTQLEEKTFSTQVQSLLTETHRAFKLLSTDMMFFTAAKSEASRQKRKMAIANHLNKIQQYYQLLQ